MKSETLKCFASVSMLALMSACGSVAQEDVTAASEPVYNMLGSINRPQGTRDIALVSRGTNLLDEFWVGSGNVSYSRYASSNWQPDVSLGAPSGIALRSVAAANNGGRIDLFAVGSDNHIWHRFSDTTTGAPTFTGWQADVPGNPTVAANSAIAVTSWEPGRLDLFWWTPSGNIGHAYAGNSTFVATETGDTPSVKYLQRLPGGGQFGDITAVSWGPARLDLFLASGKFVEHHWFDGTWGPTGSEHRELQNSETSDSPFPDLSINSVAAASRGPNNIELFVTARNGTIDDVYHLAYNGTWTTFNLGTTPFWKFEKVSHSATAAPNHVDSAIVWSDPGGRRLDVFGSGFSESSLSWLATNN